MNECCRDEIEPSLTLKRMMSLLKLILAVHFFIMIIDMFYIGTGFSFYLFCQVIVNLLALCTKHFGHFLYIIIFIGLCILLLVYTLGVWFQRGFAFYNNEVIFCFYVFILVFEISCGYVDFQIYKQAKHEFRIQYGFIGGDNDEENNNNNDNEENIPFQPFWFLLKKNQSIKNKIYLFIV